MNKIHAPMRPTFFPTPVEFRAWLSENHDSAPELWVGFYKVRSGEPSITWPEAVDEALCIGWIDGVRQRIDDRSYVIRFTPRRSGSIWSAVNVNRIGELTNSGLIQPAGLKAFAERTEAKSTTYAYEQRNAPTLNNEQEQQFRSNSKTWEFFQSQAAGYRKTAVWWVVSAKREETRSKRLATLIEDSQHGRIIAPLKRRTGLE
jgi:uncharacterized protein YdeI (YjbR/CyaY-like superfamily)